MKILYLADDNPQSIYKNIYQAIICFINYKMDTNQVEYSTEEIVTILKRRNLENKCIEIKDIIKRSEAVRFASITSNDAKEDQETVRNLLKNIDNDWL